MTMNEERPIDRIKKLAQWYIDHDALSGMKAFEVSAGLSPAYVKNLHLTKVGNPSVDAVAKIYRTFKGVSLKWLVLGEGDMFTVPEDEAIKNASKEELQAILEKL